MLLLPLLLLLTDNVFIFLWQQAAELKAAGVDQVVAVTVGDPAQVQQWAAANGFDKAQTVSFHSINSTAEGDRCLELGAGFGSLVELQLLRQLEQQQQNQQ